MAVEYLRFTYTSPMEFFELLLLAAVAAGIWFWLDSLKAREIGIAAARQACARENLQLLDETVAGSTLRLDRDDEGVLRWRRVFVFEYSDTGDNRRSGSVTLLGHTVEILHVRPQLYVVPSPHETEH